MQGLPIITIALTLCEETALRQTTVPEIQETRANTWLLRILSSSVISRRSAGNQIVHHWVSASAEMASMVRPRALYTNVDNSIDINLDKAILTLPVAAARRENAVKIHAIFSQIGSCLNLLTSSLISGSYA